MAAALRDELLALIEPVVSDLGYELVDVEFVAGRGAVLRIFIDAPERPTGVGVEDCERASREVSALLDSSDPIPGTYSLEVSSPGFDRVLRTVAHYTRFVGARVKVELLAPRDGRKRFTGELLAADDRGIELEVDRQTVKIAHAEIGKARLAPL
jgi:ribosome maturation factor RimP